MMQEYVGSLPIGHPKIRYEIMIQMDNRFVIKCRGEYVAKSQPTHPHRDGNMTNNIKKAKLFKNKPDLDEWNFGDEKAEVVTIEVFYKILDA